MYRCSVTLPVCRTCGLQDMRGRHVVIGWNRESSRGHGRENCQTKMAEETTDRGQQTEFRDCWSRVELDRGQLDAAQVHSFTDTSSIKDVSDTDHGCLTSDIDHAYRNWDHLDSDLGQWNATEQFNRHPWSAENQTERSTGRKGTMPDKGHWPADMELDNRKWSKTRESACAQWNSEIQEKFVETDTNVVHGRNVSWLQPFHYSPSTENKAKVITVSYSKCVYHYFVLTPIFFSLFVCICVNQAYRMILV